MDPSPIDDSHLYLQTTYRSQTIWDTSFIAVLSCRRRDTAFQRIVPFDQHIAPYLEVSGFPGWVHADRLTFDYCVGHYDPYMVV
ncbi:serine/threonine-protein phosphatase 7 long form-like protein [Cucumis melo var. makuwa]|uniref:Serine/threonine-protein phosphatase 7 long form-like protein n=1 Tax=Cucumis melo var. makuwa TaxID=1194695 RepID=A0A5D3DC30_CUCMM|nr:serine/threonine-protein phosphatase 7 long form-like protein [Cucumis melo var. makuwa]TYK21116.1 serine/threonine-protein phosphatase 7 long form-like protein [Cucumis melo var. makuwa]